MKGLKNLSKLAAFLLSAVILSGSASSAYAAAAVQMSGGIDDIKSYNSEYDYFIGIDNNAYITSYYGSAETVNIPAQIGGSPVTELFSSSNPYEYPQYEGAFNNNYNVTSVTFPDSLLTIGADSFFNCGELREVHFGSNLEYIGSWSFAGTSLETVDIPASVAYIAPSAFNYNSVREFVVSDDNEYYTSVDGVLYSKDMTELICVPNSMEGKFTVPDSVTAIGSYAFGGCWALDEIVIPDSVRSVGSRAFDACDRLTSISFPDSVTDFDEMAVMNCGSLENIRFPEGIKEIGSFMFESCGGLKEIAIPDSVETIDYSVFSSCPELETVDIPESVICIEAYAFYDCPKLTICGNVNSTAHIFALDNDIPFMDLTIGELDDDGQITSSDALLIIRCSASLMTLTDEIMKKADVDGDGLITSNDALIILRESVFGNAVAQYLNNKETFLYHWEEPVPLDDTDDSDDPKPVKDDTDVNVRQRPEPVKESTPDNAAQGSRNFGMEFFRRIYDSEVNDNGANVLVSPMSLYTAVAMLENGSDNRTQEEILAMLTAGGTGFGENEINSFMHDYIAGNNKNKEINMANTVYVTNRDDVVVNPDFAEEMEKDYFAEVFCATPDNATADRLNNWISKNTNGAFKDVIKKDSLDENTNSILINAIAFDGKWDKPYEEYQVNTEEFTNYDGTSVDAELMYEWIDDYYDDGYALAFKKKYEGPYSFIGILPDEDVGIDKYISMMNGNTISNLFSTEAKADVLTKIPKFEFDNDYSLNDTLKDMGMKEAFDPRNADLSRLTTTDEMFNTYVSYVNQLTHVKLDEKGTKAEAVTIIGNEDIACATDVDEPTVIEIVLDRPFIYVIYDEVNEMPIFIGTVCDMTK